MCVVPCPVLLTSESPHGGRSLEQSEGRNTDQMAGGQLGGMRSGHGWSLWDQSPLGRKAEVWSADKPSLFPSVHRGVW